MKIRSSNFLHLPVFFLAAALALTGCGASSEKSVTVAETPPLPLLPDPLPLKAPLKKMAAPTSEPLQTPAREAKCLPKTKAVSPLRYRLEES